MSHNFPSIDTPNAVPISLTIINYVAGGELITLAELQSLNLLPGSPTIVGITYSTIPPSANSLGVSLFPIFDSGKTKLFQFVGGSPVEIPSTVGLNATLSAILLYH